MTYCFGFCLLFVPELLAVILFCFGGRWSNTIFFNCSYVFSPDFVGVHKSLTNAKVSDLINDSKIIFSYNTSLAIKNFSNFYIIHPIARFYCEFSRFSIIAIYFLCSCFSYIFFCWIIQTCSILVLYFDPRRHLKCIVSDIL